MPTQTEEIAGSHVEKGAAIASCVNNADAVGWYQELKEQVDYHCSFCEGLHIQVTDLEKKAKDAYARTAEKTVGIYDQKEIATLWFGMFALASEIYAMAHAAGAAHQICGADLSGIEGCVAASLGNFEIHCPISLCVQ